ncbi:unnamed protein product [Gongylonema pulchrum]|uniref:Uncharacterized protein n=1 Tax=Gongylonema pulchrum TaxID=637853 RepID=A0A3P7P6N9_9BILA|nr:unnamed protein product [Gongylonema pulchrum]
MNGSTALDTENAGTVSEPETVGQEISDLEPTKVVMLPGEYIQPRYLPQNACWQLLTSDQLKGTIFETMDLNPMLSKINRHPFNVLVDNAGFVSDEQLKRVEEVRKEIGLDMGQICYGLMT